MKTISKWKEKCEKVEISCFPIRTLTKVQEKQLIKKNIHFFVFEFGLKFSQDPYLSVGIEFLVEVLFRVHLIWNKTQK